MAEENGGQSKNSGNKRKKGNSDTKDSDYKKAKLDESLGNVEWSEEMDHSLIKYMEENCEHLQQQANRPKYISVKNIKWASISQKFFNENGTVLTANDVKNRWEHLVSKVRKVRTVPELLEDVKEFVNMHLDTIPKKPQTAYQIFCSLKRPGLHEKYPAMSLMEMTQRIGKKWRELPADKKAKYEKKALKVKEDYDEELKRWKEDNPSAVLWQQENQKKKASSTSPSVQIKQVSPFDVFCTKKSADLESKYPDLDKEEIQEKLKRKWGKLKDSKRQKYTEKAEAQNAEAMKTSKKKNKTNKRKRKDPNALKQPLTSYKLYFRDQRQKLLQENSELDFATISKMVSASWKETSKEEIERYKELAKAAKETY